MPVCDGTFKSNPLKKQSLRFTDFNGTDMKHQIWAGSVSSKIPTILNHWRRLKSNPERRRQALQKAAPKDAEILLELLALKPGHGEAWKNANEACKKAKKARKELEEPTKEPMGGKKRLVTRPLTWKLTNQWR